MVSSTPRPHFTPGKDPVPILQEAGWAPGPVCTGGKSRPHRDSMPDRPARSQSLYRLSYPANTYRTYVYHIYIYKLSQYTGSVLLPVRHKNQLIIFRSLIRLAVINTNGYKYGARKNQGGRNKFWEFLILFTLDTVIINPSAFINTECQDTRIILRLVNFSD